LFDAVRKPSSPPPLPAIHHPIMSSASPPEAKKNIRRSTEVLRICSTGLLILGCIDVSPVNSDWVITIAGAFSLAAGASGLLGLWLKWQRGLALFTMMSWIIVLMTAIVLMQYVLNSSADAFKWTMWVITGCFALPAALLSTTMHVLRVWRGPRPLEDDNQHRAPLVDAAADVGQIDAAPAPPPPGRPVWPPPAGHAGLGADLLATGRVASAAQSGDYSQLSARDLAAASRTANAAAVVWPPPK